MLEEVFQDVYTCLLYTSQNVENAVEIVESRFIFPHFPRASQMCIRDSIQSVGDAHPAGLFGQRHQCGSGADIQRAAAHGLGGVLGGHGRCV